MTRDLEIAFVVATRLGPVALYRPRRRRVFGRAVMLTLVIYALMRIRVGRQA